MAQRNQNQQQQNAPAFTPFISSYSYNPYNPFINEAGSAISSLQSSPAYRQAGREGKERMEKLVGMGLPFNIDPSGVRKAGLNQYGQPQYMAPSPLPFGSYGGFGQTPKWRRDSSGNPIRPTYGNAPIPERMRDRVTQSEQDGGPQPEQKPAPQPVAQQPAPMNQPTGYIQSQYGRAFSRTPMGFTGDPVSFTYGGGLLGVTPKPTATSTQPPFPELNTGNYFSSTMGGIKFPFS